MAQEDNDIIKRKPSAKDWDKVRALYVKGETPDDICKALPHVALSVKNIYKRMSLEGVTAKKRALDDKILDNILSITEEEKKKVNNDCIRLFNTGAEVITKILNKYERELEEGKESKFNKATAYNVDMLMSGVTKIQKGLRVAYGMDSDGKLYEKEPEVLTIEGLNTDKI